MENKENDKKNHDDKAQQPKAPLKDLPARKEDSDKVQGGTIAYGPET